MRPDDIEPPCPRFGRGPGLLALALATLLGSVTLAGANDDAHRLAERFAGASREEAVKAPASPPTTTTSTSTARDPAADAHARAKAVEAARAAQKARQQAEARRREAERRAAEMKADEAKMLERVRAELDQLQAEERAAQAAEREAAETLSAMGPHPGETTVNGPGATGARTAQSAPVVMVPAVATPGEAAPAAKVEAADVAALEALREQEGKRLEEKLAKARQTRLGAADSAATGPAGADEPAARETARVMPPAAAAAQPETSAVAGDGAAVSSVMFSDTVTILLALEPGSTGIRRHNSTADPVICIGPDCYVSEGAGLTARKVTRGQVAGPVLTLGRRAGACNQRTACVYRNVPLPAAMAMLQPIDLRLLRHDRREEVRIAADPSCALAGAGLACQKLVRGPDWIAWIVPETIAAQAGADRLETALAQKLGGQRTAVLRPLR